MSHQGTIGWVRAYGWWSLAVLLLVAVLIPFRASTSPESELPVLAESSGPSSGFKVTFGLERRFHGASWSGGVRDAARVRSIAGWHLHDEDQLRPGAMWDLRLLLAGLEVSPKGVILDLQGPEERPVTLFFRQGDLGFVPSEIPYGTAHYPEGFGNDVSVERVPLSQIVSSSEFEDDDPALIRTEAGTYWLAWVAYRTLARDGYFYDGADAVMVAQSRDGRSWSRPTAITEPGDHFRVALAEDGDGRVWCVYGLQRKSESGNFDLYAKSFDGSWSEETQLTSDPRPDIFHKMTRNSAGNLYLTWMGYRPGSEGALPQSEILLRAFTDGAWGSEVNVSQSNADDWEPAICSDASGRVWVAWDSYGHSGGQPANYDILLRSYEAGKLGSIRAVSATQLAEMRADVVADGENRLWITWEEGGANWGKDTGYENPKHRIRLKEGGSRIYGAGRRGDQLARRPRVAVLQDGRLQQPQNDISESFPSYLRGDLFQNPRLGVDGHGKVWVFLRHQLIARGRQGGHMFDFYATTLTETGGVSRWVQPVLLPSSTGRQDTVLATAPGSGSTIAVAVVGDGRRLPVGLPKHHDVSALFLDGSDFKKTAPNLVAFIPSAAGDYVATHPDEAAEVQRFRDHRVTVGSQTFKIVRGDLHRHTEISMDGAIDGSLWDCYRYAMNAADFDFIGVTDHNYGSSLDTDEPEGPNTDDEFQWWRTQKSADLFHVPGRFVPLYGYERSPNFPLGHRNIFHARRGVFSYRVPRLHISERPELWEQDAQGLWRYLRETDGLGIPHTSATAMGTDWRLRDDEVIPVTEIYQGDRNSYEEVGAPRAAVPENLGPGSAGRSPFQKGLVRNALGVGYKMGFIASSDHFSTHISYTNLLVPDGITTRDDIQESLLARRTYGSTDNIIVDFHSEGTIQGGELTTSSSPTFQVRVFATAPILKVEIIKNNRVIYTRAPSRADRDPSRLEFVFRDVASMGGNFEDETMAATSEIRNWERPETGIRPRRSSRDSYYYVRVLQSYSRQEPEVEGEIAWSSPIFVTRE